jgi:alkyl hydroperoxide reductase subunit AhpC
MTGEEESVTRSAITIIAALAVLSIWGMAGSASAPAADLLNQAEYGPAICPLQAKVGEPAPNFSLDAVIGREFKKVSLGDYRGKWVVLFFYPLDFTSVCPTEIRGFNERLDAFKELNTVVLGASVDSRFSHLAWIQRGDLGDLKYPLLADFRKEVAERYGILDKKEGVALRGLFIIDPYGILQYLLVHSLSVGRSVEETLRVLEALQTGELCPIGWRKGEKTLGK